MTLSPDGLHAVGGLDPCTLVIFGVTGDLTHRKLAPALYDIACHGAFRERFSIIGFGRRELSDDDLLKLLRGAVDDFYGGAAVDGQACERVFWQPRYVQGEFDDPAAYQRLRAVLEEAESSSDAAPNRIFYLATPPSLFATIICMLGRAGLGGRAATPGMIAAAVRGAGLEAAAAGIDADVTSLPTPGAGLGGQAKDEAGARTGSDGEADETGGRAEHGSETHQAGGRTEAGGQAAAAAGRPAEHDDRLDVDEAIAGIVSAPAGWTRIVIEKPFGRDLESAHDLNKIVRSVFHEKQVFRIDHYLAKETVQNILMFRFGNVIFEPLWNRRYVDHVQITAAETLGVEHRGPYYEESGALRDMIQNHLMQLLALVAMEPPVAFHAEAVRDEKVKVLRAVRPLDRQTVKRQAVRGQYGDGVIAEQAVRAYREEERVSPTSPTETYAALKLFIDNWRWEGVPFYLRTGKRLPRRVTEIAIEFKRPPFLLFRKADLPVEDVNPNMLVLRIQPDEGISLRFQSKVPGEDVGLQSVTMDFSWGSELNELPFSAYETLLLDVIRGDATLFNRDDQVEESWRLVGPVLRSWESDRGETDTYVAGSWGPEAAVAMLAADGRRWRRP